MRSELWDGRWTADTLCCMTARRLTCNPRRWLTTSPDRRLHSHPLLGEGAAGRDQLGDVNSVRWLLPMASGRRSTRAPISIWLMRRNLMNRRQLQGTEVSKNESSMEREVGSTARNSARIRRFGGRQIRQKSCSIGSTSPK